MIKVLYVRNTNENDRDRFFINELLSRKDLSVKVVKPGPLSKFYRRRADGKFDVDIIINFTRYTKLTHQAKANNILVFNRALPAMLANDKWACYLKLNEIGIPQPKTSLTQDFKAPYIFKERKGSFGINVELIETDKPKENLDNKYIFQEYIKESAGKSVRVVMVGGKPVAWLLKANEKSFLSHYRYGGESYPFDLTPEACEMCSKAVNHLGLDYCALDLLISDRGLLLLEINAGAGLKGIEEFTGVNVPKLFIDYAIVTYRKKKGN